MGLNPEGESLTADPCGGRDGSEGRAGLGCLVSVSWSVSVLPKASPDPPAVAPLRGPIAFRGRIWDWEGERLRTQTGEGRTY